MNKIEDQLNKIKSEGRIGLMTHIVIGYPNLETSKAMVETMAEAGVDFIELQIPFSDPVADGPTISKANQDSLDRQTSVKQSMELMAEITKTIEIPLLFMTYFNIVFNYGVKEFCHDARQAGCSGLIIPDIPLEEENEERFIHHCEENSLIAIRSISPASTDDRLGENAEVAKGFVYFAGRKGITGSRTDLDSQLLENIDRVKKFFKIPLTVGFGLSKPEHIKQLRGKADVAVIGSALIDVYNQADSDKILAVKNYLNKLKQYDKID
ncbi:tryptophan synthase subunit alpha [Candidatus Falkowbacteria bacterium CG_4_10_14_0_2_um_filter_41_15]|uniref:Tryptophan synthase alpha chain n=1 Tax=Candidatus Falkowbacteria bacterium CG_4_10_14_0_2_um_filter_41_15 TaxID=1974554 RepID=A0A2M7VZY4_9BACT|nr:MAG: tryptophan synthase subunit alpha [Candidatus Falkowbacteria bacterium CG_4_10_14_0_2_um_filter_41_15]